jgi:hypothetical protein
MGVTKRLMTAVMVVFLVVGTSACTTGRTPLPRTSSPAIQASSSPGFSNEAFPTKVTPESISLPWHLWHVDDVLHRIYLQSSNYNQQCSAPYAATVEETTTSVTITVHGSKRSQGPCTAQLDSIFGFVQLAGPLGQRSVLHAATSSF